MAWPCLDHMHQDAVRTRLAKMAFGVTDGKEHRCPALPQTTWELGSLVQQGFIWAGYAGQAVPYSNLKPYDPKIPVWVESMHLSSERALAVVVCHPGDQGWYPARLSTPGSTSLHSPPLDNPGASFRVWGDFQSIKFHRLWQEHAAGCHLVISLCAREDLGGPVPGLGLCQQVPWATHKPGAARAFIDHQKLGCTVHRVPHPCHLLACRQTERVLLISQGCQGSTCPAQAAHRGMDQDNPKLLPGLRLQRAAAWESLQTCPPWDYGLDFHTAPPQGDWEICASAFKHSRVGECGCKGRWCKSRGELPGLQPFF